MGLSVVIAGGGTGGHLYRESRWDDRVTGNVGGNEWNVDGVSNNGSNGRTVGYLPHADEIAEMKVETSGFDANVGHSTGVFMSMMTKAGTNIEYHGTASDIIERNSRGSPHRSSRASSCTTGRSPRPTEPAIMRWRISFATPKSSSPGATTTTTPRLAARW